VGGRGSGLVVDSKRERVFWKKEELGFMVISVMFEGVRPRELRSVRVGRLGMRVCDGEEGWDETEE